MPGGPQRQESPSLCALVPPPGSCLWLISKQSHSLSPAPFGGSGRHEGASPVCTEEAWRQRGGMGPALGPPALSSAETAASWGNVLYLNQARGLLSHRVSFRMQSWYSLRLSTVCVFWVKCIKMGPIMVGRESSVRAQTSCGVLHSYPQLRWRSACMFNCSRLQGPWDHGRASWWGF